jgi:hypothetical protein
MSGEQIVVIFVLNGAAMEGMSPLLSIFAESEMKIYDDDPS